MPAKTEKSFAFFDLKSTVSEVNFSLVGSLVALCEQRKIKNVLLSPGSRNFSFIQAFTANDFFDCQYVHDERSAGYRALGTSLSSGEPTILLCTSGTAALNYSPSIAEAYYQNIPLLIITADRPEFRLDQFDGQAIHQNGIFQNFIRDSPQFHLSYSSPSEIRHFFLSMNRALNILRSECPGPVHFNIPLEDPAENAEQVQKSPIEIIEEPQIWHDLSSEATKEIQTIWENSRRKIILVGQHCPNPELFDELKRLASSSDVLIFKDLLANLPGEGWIEAFDRILKTVPGEICDSMAPDVLIYLGGQVVSKELKNFLRRNQPLHQWRVDIENCYADTFDGLTRAIRMLPDPFLKLLSATSETAVSSEFKTFWIEQNRVTAERQAIFLQEPEIDELSVFCQISQNLPPDYAVHWANSMSVRYAQFFSYDPGNIFFSNRGTGGIDGCLSTAVGYAKHSGRNTLSVIGDTAFFYDFNALWQGSGEELPKNLRIILINNSGGGIFRFVYPQKESAKEMNFLEAPHSRTAEQIKACLFADYFAVKNKEDFQNSLRQIFSPEQPRCAILEIFTDSKHSAEKYRKFFSFLSQKHLTEE